ncbi:hypothetical protein CK203_021584 [Vitis vinifera]|uniref:Uncharacterized protein n=1 Tax=Vitis vinifera TaxID=29760 RepID=A0A438J4W6_VITVI|nr:hypothetical protein CK203_021584 [Vitis vinifera]
MRSSAKLASDACFWKNLSWSRIAPESARLEWGFKPHRVVCSFAEKDFTTLSRM